jgi:hypothetical protein
VFIGFESKATKATGISTLFQTRRKRAQQNTNDIIIETTATVVSCNEIAEELGVELVGQQCLNFVTIITPNWGRTLVYHSQ